MSTSTSRKRGATVQEIVEAIAGRCREHHLGIHAAADAVLSDLRPSPEAIAVLTREGAITLTSAYLLRHHGKL